MIIKILNKVGPIWAKLGGSVRILIKLFLAWLYGYLVLGIAAYGFYGYAAIDEKYAVIYWTMVGFVVFGIIIFVNSKIIMSYVNLTEISAKDPLTGLYNVRFMWDNAPFIIGSAKRRGEPVCICFVDMDNLKEFNQKYSHEAGSIALKIIANELAKKFSRPDDLKVRYGGDEFAVIWTTPSPEKVQPFIQDVEKHFASLNFYYRETEVKFSATVGFYCCQAEGEEVLQKLIREGSEDMYCHKSRVK